MHDLRLDVNSRAHAGSSSGLCLLVAAPRDEAQSDTACSDGCAAAIGVVGLDSGRRVAEPPETLLGSLDEPDAADEWLGIAAVGAAAWGIAGLIVQIITACGG